MTDRGLMQQALDALEKLNKDGWILADFEDEVYAAIDALRTRLAQPEQEPVAWMYNSMGGTRFSKTLDTPGMHRDKSVPLYTAPPQREFIGLTDEEIREFEIWLDDEEEKHGWNPPSDIVKYIEVKLKEKNT